MPLVVADLDDGLRPAGPQDACFYCQQKVGTQHRSDCAVVTKKVRVRVTLDYDITVPYSWDSGQIEFHRNDSSWCSSNLISELEEQFGEDSEQCLCGRASFEVMGVVDPGPNRELRDFPLVRGIDSTPAGN